MSHGGIASGGVFCYNQRVDAAAKKPNKLSGAPLGRLIFFLGLQSGLALMSYSLFALADTYFISVWVGDIAAGAVAATVPITLIMAAVSTMVGAGGGSVISRALSGGDTAKAAKIAANIFLLYWCAAILVTVFGLIFIDPLLKLFGAGGRLFQYAKEYAVIMLAGAVTGTGFSSLMRAEGCTKFALLTWVIPISLNIIGDVVFIYVFGWGVRGAAAATVLSQCVSVAMSLWFFFVRKGRAYKITLADFKPDFRSLGEVAVIGLPSLLTQLLSAVQIILLNRFMLASGGENAVVAIGFAVKVQSFLILVQSGMVQGVQPVIAYNINPNPRRAKNAFRIAAAMSMAAGIIIAVAGLLLRRPALSLFTGTEEILDTGSKLLFWMLLPSAVSFASGLVTGGYQSAGRRTAASVYTLGAGALIKFPTLIIFYFTLGFDGVCYSFLVSELIIAAVSLIIIKIKPIAGGNEHEKRYKNQAE